MAEGMIEKVATALAEANQEDFEETRHLHLALARAAIKAMREPTEEMVNAGRNECVVNREQAIRIHSAMIDAALAEENQP